MSETEKHSELWNAIINKAPFEEIKKMVEAGADLNEEGLDIDFTKNYQHFYFDVFYTCYDHPDCFELVKLFVEHGYDVKKLLKNSTNAVTNAVVCPDSRVFFYLYNIDKNVMLDKRDARGATILTHAVYHNRTTEVIRFLFELGAKIDDTYEHGWGLAHFATSNPNPQIMQTLIDYGVAIEDRNHKELKPFQPLDYSIINDPDDRRLLTPLGIAALEGTPEICEILIKAGARLEARDKFGCTPLMLSTRNKNPDVFRLLLKYGANVNALDYMKQGVLNHALRFSSLEIVKQIAELTNANFHNYNYEIYIKNIEKMKTTRALAHKDDKFLKSLLEVGIDPELPKETKLPYIFLAAENPDLRVLDFLEEKGCDLTLGTPEENIVIHALEHNPNPKVIDYLINKKLFVKDNYFISEHIAKNHSVEIWKRILELGMPLNYQDGNGSSLLIKYLSNNPQNYEVARLLSDKTTVNLKDKKGMTACHIACQFADLNYLNILKEAGALLNESECKTGFTPIMVACSQNPNPGFIKFFMDNLVSVRQKTFGDLTLAHFATSNPNPYVMQILIDNAVSYDREELENLKTPLCFAAASGSLELCELLVKNRCLCDPIDIYS